MKKIKYLEFLPIIIISFFAFRLINEKFFLTNLVGTVLKIISPFFWALAIGYIVNMCMSSLEKRLKFSRRMSLSFSYILVFATLSLFFILVIPRVINTIPNLINDSSDYARDFSFWYETNIEKHFGQNSNEFDVYINNMIIDKMEDILKFISELAQNFVSKLGKMAISVTTGLIEFFIGLVVSVYVLSDKEKFFAKTQKLSTAYCGEKFTKKAKKIINDTDIIFGNYLVAKTIDSFIIGLIAIIGFNIIGINYAFLFGIIIGITNMIPYFGPIIGLLPVVLITVFISPIKAFWAFIFVLVLQQVDGNIIGPKIVGEKLGLPPLWGVVSVTIGGSLFGFMGMLLGTPVFAIIRKIILDIQDKKLEKRNLLKEQIDKK